MVNYVVALFRFTVTYVLCLYYSLQALLGIILEFFTSSHVHFLHMKKRPYPPQCLVNHNYGEHNFITVNGIKLHYVDKGDNTKPLMVLIHGFPEFWFSWRFQLNEFSKDYWVVAPDLRGYGDSEKPTAQSAYRIDNITNDIRELVKALGREKFTLVAHDWGAVVGWNYVTKYMDTVEKYIMMGAPSRSVQRKLMLNSLAQFQMSWYVFFFQAPWLPEFQLKLCDLKMFESMFKKHDEDVIEAYKYTFSKKHALTYPINYYRANTRFFVDESEHNPKVPEKFAPGLYLLGEKDMYISKDSGPELQKMFKNLQFQIVPRADHFCQQDEPEEVNRLMREFLAKTE